MAFTLANSPVYANNRRNLTFNGQPAPNFFLANPNASFAQALTNSSFSNYNNSLQAELRRRMSKGLMLQANYTFSKAITDSEGSQSTLESYRTLRDIRLDRHRASYDQTHRVVGNFLYNLPFGTGRRWLNSVPVVRKVLEVWVFGGIFNWQSGGPLGVFSGRTTFNLQRFQPGQFCLRRHRRFRHRQLWPDQWATRFTARDSLYSRHQLLKLQART